MLPIIILFAYSQIRVLIFRVHIPKLKLIRVILSAQRLVDREVILCFHTSRSLLLQSKGKSSTSIVGYILTFQNIDFVLNFAFQLMIHTKLPLSSVIYLKSWLGFMMLKIGSFWKNRITVVIIIQQQCSNQLLLIST